MKKTAHKKGHNQNIVVLGLGVGVLIATLVAILITQGIVGMVGMVLSILVAAVALAVGYMVAAIWGTE